METFLGERLLNWIYREETEVFDLPEAPCISPNTRQRLVDNYESVHAALHIKRKVRKDVDRALELAGCLLLPLNDSSFFSSLDFTDPEHVERFRHGTRARTHLHTLTRAVAFHDAA